jgi:plastocyanin
VTDIGQKQTTMKIKNLFTVAAVSAGLAFSVAAQAHGKKHEEQTINQSDVPAAVQTTANTEAAGGKIVRWEKKGNKYEAVVEKDGKEWGIMIDANGKMLRKRDESKEHKEKGGNY